MVGRAKTHRLTTSGVGVRTAATMKMMSTAQRKWRSRKRGRHDTHLGEEQDEDRQLEHQAEPQDHHQQKAEVALDRDDGLERLADTDQEVDRQRKGDVVGERSAQQEEERPANDERGGVALFAPVEARCDEAPDLVENEGGGQEERCQRGHLDVQDERIRDAEKTEARPFGQYVHDRSGEELEDLRSQEPAAEEADRDGHQGAEDALAQLFEMSQQAHPGKLFLQRLGHQLPSTGSRATRRSASGPPL